MEYADLDISDAECRAIRAGSTLREGAERRGLTEAEFRAQVEAAEKAAGKTPGNSVRSREESEQIKAQYQHHITTEEARRSRGVRKLIGRDTDVPEWRPEGDRRGPAVLEARHDIGAYLSQSPDWNPSGIDFGSFDRDAFYYQMLMGKREGREWRAMAEGAQSSTVTGAGVLVPLEFAASVLNLLRANLVFTQC
jgi:hypothetical protein